ncbi:MAG: hypothetical protein ACYCS1_05310 [Gammaproteobacteria bacterium]
MNDEEIWRKHIPDIEDIGILTLLKCMSEARADQKQKDIEKLEKGMPYPEEVFIPRSKAEIKRVVELIKKNNLSPDAIFGEYMRRSWQNAIAKLKEE